MTKPRAPLFSFALLALLDSCSIARDDAEALLSRGRYPEAMALLRGEEARALGYPRAKRARYSLSRGLTHLSLGDGPGTERWLGEAWALYRDDPSCLSADDAARLRDAWTGLGRGF